MAELTNPQNTPEPDGATLTIESDSDLGTLYSYSKAAAFGGDEAANAAEIMAQGVGQAPVIGTNTRVVTGQDGMTDHYAGWVQDSEGYGSDLAMEFHIATDGETLTIPGGTGTYDFHIDWGDGVEEDLTTVGAAHEYALAGDYVVRVSGVFPHVSFSNAGDVGKLIKILNWGDVGTAALNGAYFGATNLVEVSSGVANTSEVTSLNSFMREASNLINPPDLRDFDTGNITSASYAFYNMQSMTSSPDFSRLDTKNIIYFTAMCRSWFMVADAPKVGGWDMRKAQNIDNLFSSLGFSLDNPQYDIEIDKWEIPLVTNATSFLANTTLTTACYDRTLASWGNQTLAAGALSTTIHFGSSTYTDQASKDLLLAQCAGIIDGGVAP